MHNQTLGSQHGHSTFILGTEMQEEYNLKKRGILSSGKTLKSWRKFYIGTPIAHSSY